MGRGVFFFFVGAANKLLFLTHIKVTLIYYFFFFLFFFFPFPMEVLIS